MSLRTRSDSACQNTFIPMNLARLDCCRGSVVLWERLRRVVSIL